MDLVYKHLQRYSENEYNEMRELLRDLYDHATYFGTDIDTGMDDLEEKVLRLAETIRLSQERRGATP